MKRWYTLAPETWRTDLLRIVLRTSTVLGVAVYVPSVTMALRHGLESVAALDTIAIAVLVALAVFARIPTKIRAVGTCLVFYAVGIGLMIGVGSISQIYLFGFSLLSTLLLSVRWGLSTVVLNALSMLVIGYVRIMAPEMRAVPWAIDFSGWGVITGNFVFVNASLVLVLGAVIEALESALARAVADRSALEDEAREREIGEASLRENRAILRIAGRTARLGGWRATFETSEVIWSDETCEIYEVPPGTTPTFDEAIAFFAPEHRAAALATVEACVRTGAPFDIQSVILTAKGNRIWVRVIGNAVRDVAGKISQLQGALQDITPQKEAERKQHALEEQLRQSQKMETVGNLAGGIAHDFNNLLSIVLSYSQLLAADLDSEDPARADLAEIEKAGQRAVELTRQLLAFSRQQVLEPRIVDLTAVVTAMQRMLGRLIGEDIELTASASRDLEKVLVDPGQIEQVILNLAVNARDAMPRGGTLTIETKNVVLDETYALEHVGVNPGMHVMLAVRDTGSGMSAATMARIFEPFFTTKEKGKGTGLGLATVFGIVQQSGGTIHVTSELGEGTTFRVYFPAAVDDRPAYDDTPERGTARGTETILLVEDEEAIRNVTCKILRRHGYTVIDAPSGAAALVSSQQHPSTIHLLLTDVVMPRMSGRELAEQLVPLRPGLKVLYMSGYTDDAVVRHGVLEATLAFIQKPLTPQVLLRKVRETLAAE